MIYCWLNCLLPACETGRSDEWGAKVHFVSPLLAPLFNFWSIKIFLWNFWMKLQSFPNVPIHNYILNIWECFANSLRCANNLCELHSYFGYVPIRSVLLKRRRLSIVLYFIESAIFYGTALQNGIHRINHYISRLINNFLQFYKYRLQILVK